MTRLLAVVVAAAVAVSACGSDGAPEAAPEEAAIPTVTDATVDPEPTPTPTPTAEPEPTATAAPEATATPVPEPAAPEFALPEGDYPPGDAEGIAAMIDPIVADLGLRFTYGDLIDRTANATFQPSPTGDHFAVYVEPVDDTYTDAEYVTNTWILAQRLTPLLFASYPGLASYDVCQEPPPAENTDERPPPFTQLDIFRGPASTIDWENGSLADLIESNRDDRTTTLRLDDRLQQLPQFVEELRKVE